LNPDRFQHQGWLGRVSGSDNGVRTLFDTCWEGYSRIGCRLVATKRRRRCVCKAGSASVPGGCCLPNQQPL